MASGHVLDGDADEAIRDRLRRAPVADLGGKIRECPPHGRLVNRLVAAGPEDRRKKLPLELSGHDVGIGDREWSAAPVAQRSRIGTGALGPGAQTVAVEGQDRAPTRGNRVDRERRRAQADARYLSLKSTLIFAGKMRNVRRCAAHVETDDTLERPPRAPSPPCRPRPPPAPTGLRRGRERSPPTSVHLKTP